jgi:DNA-binding NarL/FixJ family response regulator
MAHSERSLRLIFADDNASFRRALRGLLELVPHLDIVGEAVDGDEAVRLVESTPADVVLLDVEMPRLDGISAAERIRSSQPQPQPQILVHSATVSDRSRSRAATLGLAVLDKSRLGETINLIERIAAAREPSPSGSSSPA